MNVRKWGDIWVYENRLVLIFAIAGGIASLDAQAVFYLMPFASKELHLDNSQIGVIAFAVMIGWAVSGLLAGPWSDRVSRRKPFLVGTFILFAVFSTFSAASRSFDMLFGSRLLMGFAEGPVIPIQQAVVMAESSPHRRGLNMGIVQNFGSFLIGGMLGSVLMVHVATMLGWRAAFLIAGLPGLVVAILIAWIVREPPIEVNGATKNQSRSLAGQLRRVATQRNVQLCAVCASATNGWFYIVMTFLPLWLLRELRLSAKLMSVLVGTVGLAGMISSVVVPGLSDRFGRRPLMMAATFVGIIVPAIVLGVGRQPLLIGLGILMGSMAIGTLSLSCSTIPIETVPSRDAATATALIIATAQVGGGLVGPVTAGFLADEFGLAAPLWAAMALILIATIASVGIVETAPVCRSTHLADDLKPVPDFAQDALNNK